MSAMLILPARAICQKDSVICIPNPLVDSLIAQSQYADFARQQLRLTSLTIRTRDQAIREQDSVITEYIQHDTLQQHILRLYVDQHQEDAQSRERLKQRLTVTKTQRNVMTLGFVLACLTLFLIK